jgi:hypothetical protein
MPCAISVQIRKKRDLQGFKMREIRALPCHAAPPDLAGIVSAYCYPGGWR